ncbi:MAG TPA: hypothetical protein PL112_11295 [Candidatus Obscuribacter sp.]|nr:hypothetical protein [Candidatus Obscuribacter sp.]HNA72191.1 hypothetical protein [Candidatus Obscuribacter sp.]HND67376.1 hypothetical protein [Candidatus Obscuribacter sp.]
MVWTTIDNSLVTIPIAGLSTNDARPPAMPVKATSNTTISPSDHKISITLF